MCEYNKKTSNKSIFFYFQLFFFFQFPYRQINGKFKLLSDNFRPTIYMNNKKQQKYFLVKNKKNIFKKKKQNKKKENSFVQRKNIVRESLNHSSRVRFSVSSLLCSFFFIILLIFRFRFVVIKLDFYIQWWSFACTICDIFQRFHNYLYAVNFISIYV